MRGITNTFAIAGIAGALMMGALAPAAAQTAGWTSDGAYYGQTYRGYYGHRGALIEAPVAARPYDGNPYAPSVGWGQCVTDEGYGRFTTCDHGGGL
jgi:hypothetical protein